MPSSFPTQDITSWAGSQPLLLENCRIYMSQIRITMWNHLQTLSGYIMILGSTDDVPSCIWFKHPWTWRKVVWKHMAAAHEYELLSLAKSPIPLHSAICCHAAACTWPVSSDFTTAVTAESMTPVLTWSAWLLSTAHHAVCIPFRQKQVNTSLCPTSERSCWIDCDTSNTTGSSWNQEQQQQPSFCRWNTQNKAHPCASISWHVVLIIHHQIQTSIHDKIFETITHWGIIKKQVSSSSWIILIYKVGPYS